MSAQPCGCDEEARWLCKVHRPTPWITQMVEETLDAHGIGLAPAIDAQVSAFLTQYGHAPIHRSILTQFAQWLETQKAR